MPPKAKAKAKARSRVVYRLTKAQMAVPVRIHLTNKQKTFLRAHRRENPDMKLQELCDWAKETFALPNAPAVSALSTVLKQPDITDKAAEQIKVNRKRETRVLEEELCAWIVQCEELGMPRLTGSAIRNQAQAICRERLARDDISPEERGALSALRFSNGWLHGFQTRYRNAAHGNASSSGNAQQGGRKPVTMRSVLN
ncbi:putative Tigger transposable elementderived protein 6, partial [Globisporangium splendens]